MTPDECHDRARQCASNAKAAKDDVVAIEFLKIAAQWRAMAVRTIFMGAAAPAIEAPRRGARFRVV